MRGRALPVETRGTLPNHQERTIVGKGVGARSKPRPRTRERPQYGTVGVEHGDSHVSPIPHPQSAIRVHENTIDADELTRPFPLPPDRLDVSTTRVEGPNILSHGVDNVYRTGWADRY